MTQADKPSFSLCAVPPELSGPGFRGMWQRLDERVEAQKYTGPELSEGI